MIRIRSRFLRLLHDEIKGNRNYILGLETTCDDTGAAIFDLDGKLISECLISQNSPKNGGIIPSLAIGQQARNIPLVIQRTLETGNLAPKQITAFAFANQPGLKGSLSIGSKFTKYFVTKYSLPWIPIHHMEAHALTPRFSSSTPTLSFPFLVLLISGGHCILALSEDVHVFKTLGASISRGSPGECFDKVARSLKVHQILPGMCEVPGGKVVEMLASTGDPLKYPMPLPLQSFRNCHFSFGCIKSAALSLVKAARKTSEHPDELLKESFDICASLQYGVAKHLGVRLQRAFEFLDLAEMSTNRVLVVSGGVAQNKMIQKSIDKIASAYNYESVYPPSKYCSDNGVMIAWNGLEKYRRNIDVHDPSSVMTLKHFTKAPLGLDISDEVTKMHIKCKWIDILS